MYDSRQPEFGLPAPHMVNAEASVQTEVRRPSPGFNSVVTVSTKSNGQVGIGEHSPIAIFSFTNETVPTFGSKR